MAILFIDFYSKYLRRKVQVTALLPCDMHPQIDNASDDPQTKRHYQRMMKTAYLLHGIECNNMEWLSRSNICELSNKYNLAVFMPSGENSFYSDKEESDAKYGMFISKELVEITRRMFRLSQDREDTYIGGFSMGGYGAILNGARAMETFGRIAALAPAIRPVDINMIMPGYEDYLGNYAFYQRAFREGGSNGKFIDLQEELERAFQNSPERVPKLFIAVGTDDSLLDSNRKLYSFLNEIGYPVSYEEGPGGHHWSTWNNHVENMIRFFVDSGQKSGGRELDSM